MNDQPQAQDRINNLMDDAKDGLHHTRVVRIAELLRATGRYGSEAAEVVYDVLAAAQLVEHGVTP